jgi:hypothetical protein
MTTLFADTFYFIALLSPTDAGHLKAIEFTKQFNGRLITTAWVLTEIADGLTGEPSRSRFLQFYNRLRVRGDVDIVSCNAELFHFLELICCVAASTKSGH